MIPINIPELLWFVFASTALLGAIGMVMGRTPIASLLFLVLTFFSLAAIYVLLGAHFIAVIQVLVYAGAIMVLFLFVIMLLNLGHDYRPDLRGVGWLLLGSVAGGVLAYLTSTVFLDERLAQPGGELIVDTAVRELGAVGAIAFPLYREFVIPFEVTSVLLLVAAIGAVVLAKRRI